MNLYVIKHTSDESELCNLEKKCLFNEISAMNYFFVEDYVDVSRSPFVKYCIRNLSFADSLENLITFIREEKISYDNFKIKYLDIDGNMEFSKRHEVEGAIGYVINGYARVDAPDIILGITCLNGRWMLGEYLKNSAVWREHNNRPQEYCNALPTRVSRAIVNIVVGNRINIKIVDPCCGIGTVVLEGISMGLDIVGFDINPSIVKGANRNLRYFDYPEVITEGNIHELKGHYDSAIVDLPYGILSIIDKNEQIEIIKSAGRLADKVAIIGVEDVSKDLMELHFNIIEKCVISKGKFKRYLYICSNS